MWVLPLAGAAGRVVTDRAVAAILAFDSALGCECRPERPRAQGSKWWTTGSFAVSVTLVSVWW